MNLPSQSTTTLADLGIGGSAVVDSIEGSDMAVQRLLEMGLTENEPVEVVGIAPFGDPIEIRVRGYELSLRKTEAIRVLLRGVSIRSSDAT